MSSSGKLTSLESKELDSRQEPESSNEPNTSKDTGKEKTVTFSDPLIGLVNSDNHRMIVPVSIFNLKAKALVDTGAMNNMVHLRWLTDNSLGYTPRDVCFLNGFGVSNQLRVVGEVELESSVHGLSMEIAKFLVVDSPHDQEVPLIFGEEFLTANSLSLNMREGSMTQTCGTSAITVHFGRYTPCRVVLREISCQLTGCATVPTNQYLPLEVDWYGRKSFGACDRCGPIDENEVVVEGLDVGTARLFPGLGGVELNQVLVTSTGGSPLKLERGAVVGKISTVWKPMTRLSGEVLVTALEIPENCEQELDLSSVVDLDHLASQGDRDVICGMLEDVKDVLSRGDADMGELNVEGHRIELSDSTPIYQKPRRFNDKISEKIEAQCQELELLDIIEPSKSPWSSPIVPVINRNRTTLLSVFRKPPVMFKCHSTNLRN